MKINLTLDKKQKLGRPVIDAFQCELTKRTLSIFPSTCGAVKRAL